MSWWTDSSKFISALTLTSPELVTERLQLEKEERRKEQLHDALSELLPWETREEESKILEEECRDAILALSLRDDTFEDDDKAMENMPRLLNEFDLDVHVGLIERLLQVDSNLVEMQAQLSGAGEQEKKFWRNYFTRCAKIRKRLGMSVEEIWGKPIPELSESAHAPSEAATEEEIVFLKSSSHAINDETSSHHSSSIPATSATPPAEDSSIPLDMHSVKAAAASTFGMMSDVMKKGIASSFHENSAPPTPPGASPPNHQDSFEMIGALGAKISYGEGGEKEGQADEDLDDLAAEIAKELET